MPKKVSQQKKPTTVQLSDLRKKIDAIDAEVVKILNERAGLSQEIGSRKIKAKADIYAPNREQQVYDKIKRLNKGPMADDAFMAIYREIMSSSLSLEKALMIGFLGPEGSHTHMAAKKKFGSQVSYYPCASILEIFQKVERDECDYGVVPIENSTEGVVTHTIDMLVDSDLKICSQLLLKINHNLLSLSPISKIKKIYSNPQVFGQCRHWLFNNMPKIGLIEVASTALAAQKAAKEKDSAAMASTLAAELNGLKIIKSNVQDLANNTTRFLVIAKQDVPPTGRDRTSVLFSIKDKVGALHAMLTPFQDNKINLTKIESRPSKKRAWDYYFFVDFEGHREDKRVQKALDQLEDLCKYLKVVGSYPVVE